MSFCVSEGTVGDRRHLGLATQQYLDLVEQICGEFQNVPKSSLTPFECVEACFEFLSEGVPIRNIAKALKIEYPLMKLIIMQTCVSIRMALKDWMEPPSTEGWKKIKQDFSWTFQFPHCIGFLDGLPLKLKKNSKIPSRARACVGEEWSSAVLYTLVDAKCKFTMIEFCLKQKCGATFNFSNISSMLKNEAMNIPKPEYLPGFPMLVPSIVLATNRFPIKLNILRPYSSYSCDINPSSMEFNRKHEVVEKCSSTALDLLERRFKVLLINGAVKYKYMEDVCYACCYLHNYIVDAKGGVNYATANNLPSRLGRDSSNSDLEGFVIRDKFRDFFRIIDEGKRWHLRGNTSWSLQMIDW